MRRFGLIDIKNITRIFLFLYIPIGILTALSFHTQFNNELESSKVLLGNDQTQYLTTIENSIELQYRELFESLLIIAHADETSTYANQPSDQSRLEAEALFLRIANTESNFDQIRLLDTAGKEQIRVNQNEGNPIAVSQSHLQNKSDRYYFQDSQQLKQDEIYVSDLDLNMENGHVVRPFKPMIRVATPIYNAAKRKTGILIINYNASYLFNTFRELQASHPDGRLQPFLISNNADYLYHTNLDKTFGFMHDNQAVSRLSIDHPLLWETIQAQVNGNYETETDLYQFIKILPGSSCDYTLSHINAWYLIARTDLTALPALANEIFFGLNQQNLTILAALAGLCLLLAASLYFMKRDQTQLQLAATISKNTHDAVLVTDHRTRILSVNRSFEAITGYRQEEVQGLMPSIFKSGKQSDDFYRKMWADLKETGRWEGELWDRKKDGTLYPKALRIHAIRQKFTKRTSMYIGIFNDLTRLKQEQESVMRLRHYHPKTNLPNETLLERLLHDTLQSRQHPLPLIYLSIENYLTLLTSEQTTDNLIDAFLPRLKAEFCDEAIIAQTSANQFVVAPASIATKSKLIDFLEDFFEIMHQPVALGNEILQLEIKAGIAFYPDDATTSEALLTKSYLAMHAAIRSTADNYAFFSKELQEAFEYRQIIASNLRTALENEEFHLVYQPQIDLRTRRVAGAEALIRWESPNLGFVSPADFIPIAEEKQFMVPLGYWIIDNAFQDLHEIQDTIPENFRLSINLSPLQFTDKNLIPFIIESALKHRVSLEQVEVEITETALMKNLDAVRTILEDLKLLGVSVAIDDFGTGFSSLSYLHHLPLNKLKVDREFIKNYPEKDGGKIAKIMTYMADTLQMTLLMEGAETDSQIQYLQKLGYDQVQGYYYSKPLKKLRLIDYIQSL